MKIKIPSLPYQYIEYAPRTYFVIICILFPCFMLIAMSYLFGCIIALFEMPEEVNNNNQILASVYLNNQSFNTSSNLVRGSGVNCFDAYLNQTSSGEAVNVEQLRDAFVECGNRDQALYQEISDSRIPVNGLSFGWTKCPYEGKYEYPDDSSRYEMLTIYAQNEWYHSFEQSKVQYLQDGKTEEQAIADATGFENCNPHHAGGSLFFFTIMTTIGYGSFTTATLGGRLIIFVFGFLAIIVFAALNAHAGKIALVICDDFACRRNWRSVINGAGAPIFWFVMMLIWYVWFAGILMLFGKHTPDNMTYFDSLWFSFITMTTVGLGDVALNQQDFTHTDMVFVPFLIQIGFVCIANFLIKLHNWCVSVFPSQTAELSSILKETCDNSLEIKEVEKIPNNNSDGNFNFGESQKDQSNDDNDV